MSNQRLLLLSNSKNPNQGYLEHAESTIKDFLGSVSRILFVPFAGVRITYDQYTDIVRARFTHMGYEVDGIHRFDDAKEAIMKAEAIAVGGGNTFHLLKEMYEASILDSIRKRVEGGLPYIGWSAGSNVACPTIRTTNDMPIVEPPGFSALSLVPFQINPHYTDYHPPGHQGETRDERLAEFIKANPGIYVVGLREGSMLKVEGDDLKLLGDKPAKIFLSGKDGVEYNGEDSLQFVMSVPQNGNK